MAAASLLGRRLFPTLAAGNPDAGPAVDPTFPALPDATQSEHEEGTRLT
ncbi:hypothetical protein [Pseudarthrobacter raffinosi]|nr:hypothetical protein [Pseudarthrobacter sp. MDT3-28]